MTGPQRASPAGRAWAAFVLTGLLLALACWALGFTRGADAAKTLLWWLTLGASLLGLARWHRPRLAGSVFLALCLVFGLDSAVQGVIRGFFGVNPQPSLIAEALANTNSSEAAGFVLEQRWPILKGLLLWLVTGLIGWHTRPLWPDTAARRTRAMPWLVGAGLLASALLHFNPTLLRQQPLLRWAVVWHRHQQAQHEIAAFQQDRQALWAQRALWQVQLDTPGPRTVVVFVGESSNSANWSWYGYPRPTARPLDEALQQLPGQLTLFMQARSPEAFTLPSLKQAFTAATQAQPQLWKSSPDFTQLARAAGFHVRWLSNQPSHEGWFAAIAQDAQEQQFINHGNWRDSSAVDADLLAPLQRMLRSETHPLELIVVHLMGQHFHFAQRCPAGLAPFGTGPDDAVMQAMQQAGRSASIRRARNDYDNAIYCGAQALADLLRLLQAERGGRPMTALYFSDHGQEVGHHRDFAGHSEQDESGHTIPLWVWRNQPAATPARRASVSRSVSLEHLDQGLHTLMGLHSRGYDPALDPFRGLGLEPVRNSPAPAHAK